MNKKEISTMRNITARKYKTPNTANTPRMRNAIFLGSGGFAHEFQKFLLCMKAKTEGIDFLTEAQDRETGLIRDFVNLDTGEITEIETDPQRAKRFEDQNLEVVKLWEKKNGSKTRIH